ncbi:MAG: aminotransferase class V-fold PLP-dependent enzyme, partial [Cytophagales bacterium]|nr:aminotransferase class V-fold PLP-dependent enzyme [Cytophagales bacterium]
MQDFDVHKIREDFPILKRNVYNRELAYFDNAATTQKPQAVIDAIVKYYAEDNANIHRGVHHLSQISTEAFENTRKNFQAYINAVNSYELVFTKGTTDALNLIAQGFGKKFLTKGDEIIVSALEHHSNLVPWQNICEEKEA